MAKTQPPSSNAAILATAGAGLLVLLGGAAFWLAAGRGTPPADKDAVRLTVDNAACQPAELTVPAGRRSFVIHNASERTLEWEILDGVMVVAERENITPGLSVTVTQRLKPGVYDITCGLLSNPRGKLTVTATTESEAVKRQPEARAFIGPLSEYRVFLSRRAVLLLDAATTLKQRIDAGDGDGAKNAWRAARAAWNELAPVWPTIGDLQSRMDPRAEYLAAREKDGAFTGFHRIEYGLWSQGSTAGLQPVAQALADDAATLKDRVRALTVAPAALAANAAMAAGRVADQAGGAQSPYAGDDLAELSAQLDGLTKSVLLVDPLASEAAPAASAALHKALDGARQTLDGFRSGDAFPAWPEVDKDGRAKIAQAFRAVAEAAGAVNPAIGLE